jgi:muramoyltetrapeptide carboxypeptidase
MIFPKALKPGDTIGIVATGSPLSPQRLKLGLEQIEKRGYKVKIPFDPSAFYGKYDHAWSNGSVEQRFNALRELYLDKSVKAILSARGGYGTAALLPLIDKKLIIDNPKPFIGLSDVTPLLVFQSFASQVVSIHGPSLGSSFADAESSETALADVNSLFEILENPDCKPSFECDALRSKEAEGQLVAGNLSMLLNCLGTDWDVDYKNKILLIEDVGEPPFKIHRKLAQLKDAGKFNDLEGLVFGRFAKCESKHGPSVKEVFTISLNDILRELSFPVLCGLPFGHWGENKPFPLGCRARINGSRLSLIDSAVTK